MYDNKSQSITDEQYKGNTKSESWRSVLTTVIILLLAPALVFFLTVYVFQTYQVDGPSMQNTLQQNDRLIVWKISRTIARLTGNPYVPNRGDIIVFAEPQDGESTDQNKQLIKRVIALPGERISIKNGKITVYNDRHPQGFDPESDFADNEILANNYDNLETTSVPTDSIFVMGDHRANSLDSRSFGPVPLDNIIGKLTFRLLPIGEARRF